MNFPSLSLSKIILSFSWLFLLSWQNERLIDVSIRYFRVGNIDDMQCLDWLKKGYRMREKSERKSFLGRRKEKCLIWIWQKQNALLEKFNHQRKNFLMIKKLSERKRERERESKKERKKRKPKRVRERERGEEWMYPGMWCTTCSGISRHLNRLREKISNC